MRMERFKAEDIEKLRDNDGQEYLVSIMDPKMLGNLVSSGDHYSFFAEDVLVGCGGVAKLNDWRGVAWALFQTGKPQYFLGLHRGALQILRAQPFRRIESYVDPTVPQSVRWIKLLGFELETPYKPYFFPDGRGAAEWVFWN